MVNFSAVQLNLTGQNLTSNLDLNENELTLKCLDKFLAFVDVELNPTFSVPFLMITCFVLVAIPVANKVNGKILLLLWVVLVQDTRSNDARFMHKLCKHVYLI